LDRVVFNGEPGTHYVNDTGRTQYQFICALTNTSGACLQYHMAIGAWWPIPIHHNCRCRQVLVPAGQTARHAFVDFREILDDLPQDQKREAIGASNYRLLKSGVVKWEDIVSKWRVRTLTEVVARKNLTVQQMTDAGVRRKWAEYAHGRIHTPEAELIKQQRKELTEKIIKAGIQREQLVQQLAQGVAKRVAVAGPGGEFQTVAKFLGDQTTHNAMLARFLAEMAAKIKWKKPEPPEGGSATQAHNRPKPPEPPAPAVAPQPLPPKPWQPGEAIDPDKPIDERLKSEGPSAEKLKAIQRFVDELEHARELRNFSNDKMTKFLAAHPNIKLQPGDPDTERLLKLENAYAKAVDRITTLQAKVHRKVNRVLDLPKTNQKEWSHHNGIGDWKKQSSVKDQRKDALKWLEPKVAKGPGNAIDPVTWNAKSGVRAFARQSDYSIEISTTGETKTMVHEMGHHLEFSVPGVKNAAQEFLSHRVGNQPLQKLKDLFPNCNYETWETGRDDDFAKAFGGNQNSAWYAGKHYNPGWTEIVSMGVERLYEDPIAFARGDPEYCQFIIGVLDGSLRKP
jgi:hypothetical protein